MICNIVLEDNKIELWIYIYKLYYCKIIIKINNKLYY